MRTKKSMRIQKIVFYGFLIASFLIVLASLAFVANGWIIFNASKVDTTTSFLRDLNIKVRLAMVSSTEFADKYPQFVGATRNTNVSLIFETYEAAHEYYRALWFSIQDLNNLIFYTGIISLALLAICAITGSFTRKKYYLSNLVTSIVTGAFGIIMSVIIIIKSFTLKGDIDLIQDDVTLYYESTIAGGGSNATTSASSSNCFIGIVLGVLFIIICAGFITYTVKRFLDTKKINSLNEEVMANE